MSKESHLLQKNVALLKKHLPWREERRPVPGWLRWLGHQMVPNIGTVLVVIALLWVGQAGAAPWNAPNAPGPSTTTINYQGRLADSSGTPLDGNYGMTFALWDASSGGNLVWGPESHAVVPVSDGLFSIGLGSQIAGGIPTGTWDGDRYLEIAVGGETLSPRELLRSVPIAGMALTVPDGVITTEKLADEAATQIAHVESSTVVSNDTTEWQDMPDMAVTITTEGGAVLINFCTHYVRSVANGAGAVFRLNIDGSEITDSIATHRVISANAAHYAVLTYSADLPSGTHVIKVRWRMSHVNPSGTLSTEAARQLTTIEFKK